MGWWAKIWRTKAEEWIFAPLEQVPDGLVPSELVAEQMYVSVALRSLRVVDVRKGISKFYGTVHSYIGLPHLSGQEAVFQTVTTPNDLRDADASRIDRIIQLDRPLLRDVPYRGGSLDMEMGLFSVKSADLVAPFVSVLEKMAEVAGVSYVSAAMPFVEPLKLGIGLLTGSSDESILEIGISWAPNPPRTGWYFVMRAPKGAVDPANGLVDKNDFRLLLKGGGSLSQYPYMLFRLSSSIRKDDWFMIPDLVQPYEDLRKAVREGKADPVRQALGAFTRTVLTCQDLLRNDARRVVKLVTDDVNEVLGVALQAAGSSAKLPELKDVPLYVNAP